MGKNGIRPVVWAAALAASLASFAVGAAPITKTVNISVYQLCTDDGSSCASTGPVGNAYYEVETNKIWAQAGISVSFSFSSQVNSTQYFDISDTPGDSFDDLYNSVLGAGMAGTNTTSVDMFLVNSYAGAYGVGYSGFGGLIMSMSDILSFDCNLTPGCTGRIDTLAHELGHNFGLVPENFPDYAGASDPGHSTDPNNLMASGLIRNVPTTAADIAPDGLALSVLPQNYIDYARQSTLLVAVAPIPEPGTVVLMGLGLFGVLGAAKRRRAA